MIIKISITLLISLIFSIILGYILVPILKKYCNQSLSIYLEEKHKEKNHTPTIGGVIFIIPPIIVMFIFKIL